MEEDFKRQEIKRRILRAHQTLPAGDYPYPLYVIVEPTNICNLHCIMCPSGRQTRPRGVMDFSIWKKIVDEVAEKSPQTILWPAIMGEALTAGRAFWAMLEYARSKKVSLILNTNGLLFDEEGFQKIRELELREIIVGLDAASAATYRKVRCGGDFDRVVQNVLRLLECRGPKTGITVQFIEQEENFHEREVFKRLWLGKGTRVKIRPKLGWGDGVTASNLILEQEERIGPCPWLMRTLSIHWDGKVVQCDADWDQKYSLGDMNTQTIEEIWNGKLRQRRERHRKMDFDFLPCKVCKDWQAGQSEFFYPEGDELS